MKVASVAGVLLVVLGLSCGPVEVRLDETRGIPSVTGSTEVQISALSCGTPITSGQYTITTRVVTNPAGCELSFHQDVQVLKASDYVSIPDLQGASRLVQRVELQIKKLAFADAATGQVIDASTRIVSATLAINGQQVADKSILSSLPKTVTLAGDALNSVKTAVDARQPASVRADCVVVVPDSPKPPDRLKVDYDAQPAIILGPGKII